ncbi:MAG: CDP-alcohol phosphatidyltransferase family protein [Lachnospiraceae bacterium]|nr:CDP-alcohol phosphatidyltransferase family protein [Lachnospiraceae bacterium]
MKKRLLGYYDYTVVLTYVGMLCAFTAILQSLQENYLNAIIFLMLAGICDMFDGAVASTKDRNKSEKRFGIQIDSLSDLISFGVMPAIFTYMIAGKTLLSGTVASGFALAALIRLAYFNVTEEERQDRTNESRTVFQGMPVTTMAVLLPIVYLLSNLGQWKGGYLVLLVISGSCFLAPFELKKPKLVGKICLIVIGIVEFFSVFFLGWDLV